jgi:RNA polymerase sigma factor (sigma-70 family)
MAYVASPSLVRQLGSLFEGGCAAGLSDRQLLERFTARGEPADEAAFAAIVARHGPMVLDVCRQLLGDHHHAEDAFQATFFVLARQARSIREPDRLGPWLYGVALRTARQARGRIDRRRRTEEEGSARQAAACPSTADRGLIEREQAEALHREIDRLPRAFRAPVVLCYFEGLTLDEAAHRLRWPVGTTRSRLARAREKLRRGLSRRGFAMSSAAVAAVLAPRSTQASVSSLLCDSTTRAAIAFAARHAAGGALSASAAALAQEVLQTMLIHKLKAAALSFLLLAVVATGAGWLARPLVMGDEPKVMTPAPARPATAAPVTKDNTAARMTVVGRALDPAGRPVPDARLAALADRPRQLGDINDDRHRDDLMGTASADADGRFTLEFPALSAGRVASLFLLVAAPGRGSKIVVLRTDAARQEVSIALAPEEPVEGRLVDVQGQPAAGVVVRVAGLAHPSEPQPHDARGVTGLWPSPATTDAGGQFRMPGLNKDIKVTFEVEDPRYARETFSLRAEKPGAGELKPGSTVTLRPPQTVEVRVVHGDDGRPVAGARVDVQSEVENQIPTLKIARDRTDGRGHASVVAWPGTSFRIHVHAPEGEPYVPRTIYIGWPKAAVTQSVEVKLERGTIVRGRLIEDPTGRPVDDAWIIYHQTYRKNPRYRPLPEIEAASGADGMFTLVVPRGPGHLLVYTPRHDHVHVMTSYGEMGVGIRPSLHIFPNAHAALDIKDGEATHPLELKLRRAITIKGRVLTPDGKPVAQAFAFGRGHTWYREQTYHIQLWSNGPPFIAVRDGQVEITGCDPDRPGTFYFLDVKDRLGAVVELPGQSATAGPVTVQLLPTATAYTILKGADGKPVADRKVENGSIDPLLVVTPGPCTTEFSGNFDIDDTLSDFVQHVGGLDPAHNENLRSGPDGRVTIVNLIPGARYRFRDREFTPLPGQSIDLDHIAAGKPPR